MVNIEKAILSTHYYNGAALTSSRTPMSDGALSQAGQACLAEWRRNVTCAGCNQRIAKDVPHTVRGIQVFHRSCAARFDVQQRARIAPKPRVLGVICGVAAPINQNGLMRHRDGWHYSERIAPGAFTASLNEGGQTIRIGHSGGDLQGSLVLDEQPDHIRYRFLVSDTPAGVRAFRMAKDRQFTGASIGFDGRAEVSYDRTVHVITRARLLHIALVPPGQKPSWYGTSVEAF